MDASVFRSKKITCKRHPKEFITQVCTAPKCNFTSILICSQCIHKDVQHITMHKNYIYKVGDFMQHQNYQIEPYLIDELMEKTLLIEQRLKDIETLCKQEDDDIDKDFGAMFAIFYKLTDAGKNQLKESIRGGFKKISERLGVLSKNFQVIKKTKIDPKELSPVFAQLSSDHAEDLIKSVVNKRTNKFTEYNTNLSSLSVELESCISSRPNYKKKESSRVYLKDMKENFEKNVNSLVNYFKCLLEYPNTETNYNQLSFTALNTTREKDSPSGRSIIDSLRFNKAQIKKLERPQTAGTFANDDTANTSFSFVGLKKLDSFPSTSNPKVRASIQKIGTVSYPPVLENIPNYEPNFQFSSEEAFEIEEGSMYQGQWRSRFRHGMGRQMFVDGGVYEGTWLDDLPNGYGRMIRKNGDYYEGEIRDFKANGKGRFGTLNGYSYVGLWSNDRKNGEGEEEDPAHKYNYKGEFVDNNFHGKGVLTLESGEIYDGEWEEGQFTGKGTYSNPAKNEKYTGSWKNFKKEGEGTLCLGDGSVYTGHFVEDLPEGFGEYKFPDGFIYRGNWRQGLQDGSGVQIDPENEQREGEWLEGDWLKWRPIGSASPTNNIE